jgi:hypothetical protein
MLASLPLFGPAYWAPKACTASAKMAGICLFAFHGSPISMFDYVNSDISKIPAHPVLQIRLDDLGSK